MKITNAHPGVEIIIKDDTWSDTGTYTIKNVREDGRVTFENQPEHFSFLVDDLRLANKPKRSELVDRIEELEKINNKLSEFYKLKPEFDDMVIELNKMSNLVLEQEATIDRLHRHRWDKQTGREIELKNTISRLEKDIASVLDGSYFDDRPQRERWQMIANLTGWWVAAEADGHLTWFRSKPVLNKECGTWDSSIFDGMCEMPKDFVWTDEPDWTKRIVGPQKGATP